MAHLWILWPALLALILSAEVTLWLGRNLASSPGLRPPYARPMLYAAVLASCLIAMLLPLNSEIVWLVAVLVLIPLIRVLLQFFAKRSDAK